MAENNESSTAAKKLRPGRVSDWTDVLEICGEARDLLRRHVEDTDEHGIVIDDAAKTLKDITTSMKVAPDQHRVASTAGRHRGVHVLSELTRGDDDAIEPFNARLRRLERLGFRSPIIEQKRSTNKRTSVFIRRTRRQDYGARMSITQHSVPRTLRPASTQTVFGRRSDTGIPVAA